MPKSRSRTKIAAQKRSRIARASTTAALRFNDQRPADRAYLLALEDGLAHDAALRYAIAKHYDFVDENEPYLLGLQDRVLDCWQITGDGGTPGTDTPPSIVLDHYATHLETTQRLGRPDASYEICEAWKDLHEDVLEPCEQPAAFRICRPADTHLAVCPAHLGPVLANGSNSHWPPRLHWLGDGYQPSGSVDDNEADRRDHQIHEEMFRGM